MPRRPARICSRCNRVVLGRCTCVKAWSTSKRAGSTRRWRKLRLFVFDEQHNICARAGCFKLCDELDHIVPTSEGGTDDRSNVEGLCKPHHDEKTLREAARARSEARR